MISNPAPSKMVRVVPSNPYILPLTIFPAASLRKLKEKGGTTTRKLIGHSGPVYSLSFDPLSGSAASPRHLLSSSADGTARLWSLDTMTNLVAYRGHQNPVWDVKWSPMGVYFATASRDRTARLWSTDRTTALRIYAGHLSDVDVGSPDSDGFRALLLSLFITLEVSGLPSEFSVFSDRIRRLDCPIVGCSKGGMYEGVHWSPGGALNSCY